MRINININNEVSSIEVWDGTNYLRITNLGEETSLQTTLKNEEVSKFIQLISVHLTGELTKPLIKAAMTKTSVESFIVDTATGKDLKFIAELMNVKGK